MARAETMEQAAFKIVWRVAGVGHTHSTGSMDSEERAMAIFDETREHGTITAAMLMVRPANSTRFTLARWLV